MYQLLKQSSDKSRRAVAAWCRARLSESRHCADCQCRVSPWDDICPGCGTLNPARVQVVPVVGAGIGLAVMVAAAVWLWW